MRALVLNRAAFGGTSFTRHLGPDWQVSLVGEPDAVRAAEASGDRYEQLVPVADYLESSQVELTAYRLHQERPFDMVVALAEFDLLRAARLRELLGIPGQSVASAMAYRDKLVMKRTLGAAGVPVAGYAEVSAASDILAFAERSGFPFVVKPRRGAGSMGVEIVHDTADLERVALAHPGLGSDEGASLLAEEYVPNSTLHVDGLIVGGEVRLIWPSTHGETSTLDYREGGGLMSCMLDRTDPRWEPSVKLVHETIAALPTPGTTLFHAEVFHTPDGRMLMNEIASRIGGAKVARALRAAFGISPVSEYLRALATGEVGFASGMEPEQLAGWLLMPPSPGRIRHIPTSCPVPDIDEFSVYAAAGQETKSAIASVDGLMTVVAVGEERAAVGKRLEETRDWFLGELVMESLPR
ncbi:ATP-grasp domain-containing protein [Streptomyces mesophilus]|uniref:ATP-grasp domain-containing protein n=1 Tax=Streptomyces mesophilus TaxID=1775132 RepID=UPI0033232557